MLRKRENTFEITSSNKIGSILLIAHNNRDFLRKSL